jgi:flagellar L-ring protein FlgH
MIRQLAIIVITGIMTGMLGGCFSAVNDVGRPPQMSPVGSGLNPDRGAFLTQPAPAVAYKPGNSLWQDSSAELFRDQRAMKIGDVVTVKISIKDNASMVNNTHGKRDASRNLEMNDTVGMSASDVAGSHIKTNINGFLTAKNHGYTESKAEGTLTRSENIDLLVAATVTEVLPNGNLVVSGQQEVRVNFELRELKVAGVVRPRDISAENAIAYDKVAEARISYGGRGPVQVIQQPGVGQQLMDIFAPF